MYRAARASLLSIHNTREEGIMNDITYAASRLAVYRADELARTAERRRVVAERTAECVLPPVREHPRVRFPRFGFPQLRGIRTIRPAV
jgi:hypothetical protein